MAFSLMQQKTKNGSAKTISRVYKQILVPLDGSEAAEKAIPYAARIAAQSGARIILFAVSGPGQQAEGRLLSGYLAQKSRDLAHLNLAACTIVQYGEAANEILDYSERFGIDLIVMSTIEEANASRRRLAGNVNLRVINEAHTPLLLVKTEPVPPDARGPWRILVPLDGSELAERILIFACGLAEGSDCEVILFGVSETTDAGKAPAAITGWDTDCRDMTAAMTGATRQYLENIQRQLKSRGVNAKAEIGLGKAAHEILRYAESNGASVIAMTTQGRSGYGTWPFGSVAGEVVRNISRPILLLRPQPKIIRV